MKLKHEQIQYVEFLSQNLERIKTFYANSFAWKFTDYGPDYIAFEGDSVDGGFTPGQPTRGSILVILYSARLEETKQKIIKAGGAISKDIFSFPAAAVSISPIPTATSSPSGPINNVKESPPQ